MKPGTMNRRAFIKTASATGAGAVGLLAACSPAETPAPTPAAAVPVAQATPDPEEIDRLHEVAVQAFLDGIEENSKTFFPPQLSFTMDGDTKVFEINCMEVEWETAPGKVVQALTYNGIVPGPEIRVTEGDNIRIIVTNQMRESTTIHWHGVIVPNNMDGVPFINQPPIKPGETFTYEFVARNPGSHMYHSHHNAAEQVTRGMLGAFIIEPKDKSADPEYDRDYILILNDTGIGLTLNGKSFPATAPVTAKLGEKIRVRFMNEGVLYHPMHLHGMPMLHIASDGWPLPMPHLLDTIDIAPGQRQDVIVDCTEPGVWAFHCHILTHAESKAGMFGMVTVLIVE